mmetsp:Transcript_8335/g.19478  ORF Transcript_8335/g.19478 Transcript_8335/m.19478 type:complete len:212 (-) Transcript_8335:60-695(-)
MRMLLLLLPPPPPPPLRRRRRLSLLRPRQPRRRPRRPRRRSPRPWRSRRSLGRSSRAPRAASRRSRLLRSPALQLPTLPPSLPHPPPPPLPRPRRRLRPPPPISGALGRRLLRVSRRPSQTSKQGDGALLVAFLLCALGAALSLGGREAAGGGGGGYPLERFAHTSSPRGHIFFLPLSTLPEAPRISPLPCISSCTHLPLSAHCPPFPTFP